MKIASVILNIVCAATIIGWIVAAWLSTEGALHFVGTYKEYAFVLVLL